MRRDVSEGPESGAMLVYGKANRTSDPRVLLGEIARLLAEAAREVPDIRRHGLLVTAFIEAGALLQGLADAEFEARGCDAPSRIQDAATTLLHHLAESVDGSWQSGFRAELPDVTGIFATLHALALPAQVTLRWAEGFAYYALYPEAYAMAAQRSRLAPDTHVLGLRSIGAPLAAMVAAGLGSDRLTTARPCGHPFHRTLRLSNATKARLRDAGEGIAVVDEGPGLSGSSFGGTLDVLRDLGVPEARVALFPSHDAPPGPQASEAHRARWDLFPRHVMPFEALLLRPERPEHALANWFADLVGPAEGPLVDISGGGWRRHLYPDATSWPPVNAWQERRKFLLTARGKTWRLKFAGLGTPAVRKAELGGALSGAGFVPQVAGLRHGFLLERWHAEATPLESNCAGNIRWLEAIGRYLGFRARTLPASPGTGAPLAELLAMARHNTAEALGSDDRDALAIWTNDAVAALAVSARPVLIDGRMQPWKWLALPDGRLLKGDALDHHAGHDLIGCQDIGWDIVGAVQEFGFSMDDQDHLVRMVEGASGQAIDPRLLAFLTPCYLAFQVGVLTLALGAATDSTEGQRIRRRLERQTARLRRNLSDHAT